MALDPTKKDESTQRIYLALRKSIVAGDLQAGKGGAVLDEGRLSEEHKVSRAVIRDVLLALKDEGLVNFRVGEGVAIVRKAKRIWPIRYLRQHRPSIRLLILLINLAPLVLLLVAIFLFLKGDSKDRAVDSFSPQIKETSGESDSDDGFLEAKTEHQHLKSSSSSSTAASSSSKDMGKKVGHLAVGFKSSMRIGQTSESPQHDGATNSYYMLQAGSFREREVAEALRARLKQAGFETTVQGVTVTGHGRLYRVRVGPFAEMAEMEKVRKKLADIGVKKVLRLKGTPRGLVPIVGSVKDEQLLSNEELKDAIDSSQNTADVSERLDARVLSSQPFILWLVLGIFGTLLMNVFVSLKLSEPIYAMRDIVNAQNQFANGKRRSPLREFFSRPLTREHKQLDEGVRQMYARLSEQQLRLERRAAEAEHFANHAIHEARNQVISSIGALELITGDTGRMSGSERKTFLTTIKANLQRLHALLDDWQEQALSDRSMPNQDHAANLREILSYVAQVHSNKQFQVTFETTIDRTTIGFSGVKLESIISSLTNNSKKHGAENVHITISTLSSATLDEALQIIVSDDGPGIADNHEHKIFDQGFTTKTDPSRSGLGLFNVRRMLALYNGTIEVVSVEQGASFRIQIPLMV